MPFGRCSSTRLIRPCDDGLIPNCPPYTARLIYNTNNTTGCQEDLVNIFGDLNFTVVQEPGLSGVGLVEFESRKQLLEALSRSGTVIGGRKMIVQVSAEDQSRDSLISGDIGAPQHQSTPITSALLSGANSTLNQSDLHSSDSESELNSSGSESELESSAKHQPGSASMEFITESLAKRLRELDQVMADVVALLQLKEDMDNTSSAGLIPNAYNNSTDQFMKTIPFTRISQATTIADLASRPHPSLLESSFPSGNSWETDKSPETNTSIWSSKQSPWMSCNSFLGGESCNKDLCSYLHEGSTERCSRENRSIPDRIQKSGPEITERIKTMRSRVVSQGHSLAEAASGNQMFGESNCLAPRVVQSQAVGPCRRIGRNRQGPEPIVGSSHSHSVQIGEDDRQRLAVINKIQRQFHEFLQNEIEDQQVEDESESEDGFDNVNEDRIDRENECETEDEEVENEFKESRSGGCVLH